MDQKGNATPITINISNTAFAKVTFPNNTSAKYAYTGTEINPAVTVEYDNKLLTNGTDYTVSYSNNIKAGQALCTIKPKNSSFTGTIYKTYTISPLAPSKIEILKKKDNSIKYEWIPSDNDNILGYFCHIYIKDSTTGEWKDYHQIKAYQPSLTSLNMPSEIKFNDGTQYKMVFCNRLFYSNDKTNLLNSTSKTMSTMIFDPADYNVDLSVNKSTAVAGEGITLTAQPTSKMNNVEYAFLYRPKGDSQWIVYKNYSDSQTCTFRLPQSSIGTSAKYYEFLVKAKSKIETNGNENTTNGLVVTDIRVGDDAVIIKPNTTKPKLTVTENPSSWTNKTVNLKINASDSSGAGIQKVIVNGKEISLTNGSAVYQVTSYGQYTFEAMNYAGNSVTAMVTVKVDKDVPNLTITGNTESWTKNDVTLKIQASDELSGLKNVTVNGTELTIVDGQGTYVVSKNGTYEIIATDNAGNTKTQTVKVNKIDKDVPNLTITGNTGNWTKNDVTLKIQASDELSGLKNVTVNGEEIEITNGTGTYAVSKNGTYKIIATDNAGNTKTQTVEVSKIDKYVPNLTITGNTGNWTKNDVTLKIQASDELSGLKNVTVNGEEIEITNGTGTYAVSKNGTYKIIATDNAGNTKTQTVEVNKIDKTLPSTTKPEVIAANNSITVTNKQEDQESGIEKIEYAIYKEGKWSEYQESNKFEGLKEGTTYKVKTKATDNAGNYAESQELIIKTLEALDQSQPNLIVAQNTKDWTNENIILTITASDEESGIKNVTVNGTELAIVNGQGTYQVSKNGTYKIIATDNAGNTETQTVKVNKIDKTLPSTTKPEVIAANNSITVTNKQEDQESGIEKIEYAIYKEGKWSEYQESNKFEGLKEGTEYKVKTKATDKVGNVSESEETMVKIPEVIYGDINNDKKIDTVDLLKLLRYVAMQSTGKNQDKWNLTETEKKATDINKDGKINTMDVLKMKRYIAASKNTNIAQKHPEWLEI